MKVYHGSTVIVKKPNIEIVDYRTNFENGFYTSLNRDTAEYWAEKKRQEILGKDKTVILKKYINVYEFTENENLSVLDFDKIDKSDYKSIEKYKRSRESLSDYDIVKGPKISEELVKFLEDYKQEKLGKEELLNMLIIYKTINDVSFYTEKAIKSLKFLYAEEIKQDNDIDLCKL